MFEKIMLQCWDEYNNENETAVHPMFEKAFKAGWESAIVHVMLIDILKKEKS